APPAGRDPERAPAGDRGEPCREVRLLGAGGRGHYFFAPAMKRSIGSAASVMIFTLPRAASSAETRAMVSLSGASTTLRKSYGPSSAYWVVTFTPSFSISLLTSLMRDGFLVIVDAPSSVSVERRT